MITSLVKKLMTIELKIDTKVIATANRKLKARVIIDDVDACNPFKGLGNIFEKIEMESIDFSKLDGIERIEKDDLFKKLNALYPEHVGRLHQIYDFLKDSGYLVEEEYDAEVK